VWQGEALSELERELGRATLPAELNGLETELAQWTEPDPPGFDLWRHKLFALIGEILDPHHSLAIRAASIRWDTSSQPRGLGMWSVGPDPKQRVVQVKQTASEIIEALRWELNRRTPDSAPFSDATIDPELWEHVRGLVDAGDWEKVAREAAVFVEDKLRTWASVPASVTGSVNVFKAAIGNNGFLLPKAGSSSEQQGWQQLASGFALALRNPSGHQVRHRDDAERYALRSARQAFA
jgi:hypothetical protein